MTVSSTAGVSNAPPPGNSAASQLFRDQQRLATDTTAKATASRLTADKQAVTNDRQAVSRSTASRVDRYA